MKRQQTRNASTSTESIHFLGVKRKLASESGSYTNANSFAIIAGFDETHHRAHLGYTMSREKGVKSIGARKAHKSSNLRVVKIKN